MWATDWAMVTAGIVGFAFLLVFAPSQAPVGGISIIGAVAAMLAANHSIGRRGRLEVFYLDSSGDAVLKPGEKNGDKLFLWVENRGHGSVSSIQVSFSRLGASLNNPTGNAHVVEELYVGDDPPIWRGRQLTLAPKDRYKAAMLSNVQIPPEGHIEAEWEARASNMAPQRGVAVVRVLPKGASAPPVDKSRVRRFRLRRQVTSRVHR